MGRAELVRLRNQMRRGRKKRGSSVGEEEVEIWDASKITSGNLWLTYVGRGSVGGVLSWIYEDRCNWGCYFDIVSGLVDSGALGREGHGEQEEIYSA